MAKRKLDNIERDSAMAMKLGYGVHYGRYKADHPHTRSEEPEKKLTEDAKPCVRCGKLFEPRKSGQEQKFCCEQCRVAHNSAIALKRRAERKAASDG